MDMISCSICNEQFFKIEYLKAHERRKHKLYASKSKNHQKKFQCKFCEKTFTTPQAECRHRKSVHGITSGLHLRFKSEKEFQEWLETEQTQSHSHFITITGRRKRKDFDYIVYHCSRSGIYVPKGSGQRQLKAQGSKKLGGKCTAKIEVKVFESYVEVAYHKEHIHDTLLSHIPIPKSAKDVIADKLLSGVNDTRILRDIRGDVEEPENRCQLVTRKDLQNVKSSMGIGTTSISHVVSDELSVKVFVEQMADNILCYKEQNTDHSVLDKTDFMLAFMMPLQKKMLAEFGSDRICIDSTHGTTGYGFELSTLMVVDEFEEGFPVAFCLSSTVNTKILEFFFQCIKEKVVPNIKAKVFMSDDASFMYEAWKNVFGDAEKKLLCAWHVDRAWQGHLMSIKEDKRKLVYKTLKTILYELNLESFSTMVNEFMEQLKGDEETIAFYDYFSTYYANRKEMWAYCFRKNARINTNMHLEHFHQELKHIYLEGKKSKRVDKCCESLRKYVLDKKYERLIKIHKGKITKRHTKSFKCHKKGAQLIELCQEIEPNNYQVLSSRGHETYSVQRMHNCNSSCNIICRACYICFKSHVCTCIDFAIQNNLCKHIHATVLSKETKTSYTGPLNSIKVASSNPSALKPISKNEDKSNMTEILERIENIKRKALIKTEVTITIKDEVIKALNDVENLLNIDDNFTKLPKVSKEPANKRMAPQTRFFSYKKPKAKKRRLSKPDISERVLLKSVLLKKELIVSTDERSDHSYLQ